MDCINNIKKGLLIISSYKNGSGVFENMFLSEINNEVFFGEMVWYTRFSLKYSLEKKEKGVREERRLM